MGIVEMPTDSPARHILANGKDKDLVDSGTQETLSEPAEVLSLLGLNEAAEQTWQTALEQLAIMAVVFPKKT